MKVGQFVKQYQITKNIIEEMYMNSFITLHNHFEYKPTYIVGNYIINGCQTFHINEIDKVCKEFYVPDRMKNQVLNLHSKIDQSKIESDLKKMIELCVKKRRFNDVDRNVRIAIAKQKIALDQLVNDYDHHVRCAVAEHGYGLDVLINDEEWLVRCTVANQDYGLDVLVNDDDWTVRCVVANQGYGLDVLINDGCLSVQRTAKQKLKDG